MIPAGVFRTFYLFLWEMERGWRSPQGWALWVSSSLALLWAGLLPLGATTPREPVASALLWISLVLGALLHLSGSTGRQEEGTRDLFLSLPIERVEIFLSRFLSTFVLSLGVSLTLLLGLLLLKIPEKTPSLSLLPVLLFGAWGLSSLGVFLSEVSHRAQGGGGLLLLLIVPAISPLLLTGTSATTSALLGETPRTVEVVFLGGYALSFSGLSWLLFEETLP